MTTARPDSGIDIVAPLPIRKRFVVATASDWNTPRALVATYRGSGWPLTRSRRFASSGGRVAFLEWRCREILGRGDSGISPHARTTTLPTPQSADGPGLEMLTGLSG